MRLKVFAGWILLAALGACRTASIYLPDVQIRLAAQPAELAAGDTARFALTVTNPGRDTLVLEFGEHCRVTFIVLHPDDRAADDSCADARPERVVLAPAEAWTVTHPWPALAKDGTPLPPGAYRVRGVLGEHDSVIGGKREFKLGHGAADTVAVRILPAGG
jgi:hypothetical protein